MKAAMNKQFLTLKGKPIIVHTLEAFDSCEGIDEIIIVTAPDEQDYFSQTILESFSSKKTIKLVAGGSERQQSAYNGLKAVSPENDIVLIHDGARPFASSQTIMDCIEQAKLYGAVSAGMPSKDTVKLVDEAGMVSSTPDRDKVWLTQTPQAFKRDIIIKAHENALENGFLGTDDAMLAELAGYKVKMVAASYGNMKITTPEDIAIAEVLMDIKEKLL
ncbi:MAG: 2-C-methyl-D-erythritol 4-phosphate cytidylyltransferase [Clostridia bacterium]|jgi:2-C-methyl-D-erythritol 4-phosphate cytidylyltransferase|nr:2-C-methyl-D-erythritol 4-phosphate cytidylyltransferase [Clostridia bacterium]